MALGQLPAVSLLGVEAPVVVVSGVPIVDGGPPDVDGGSFRSSSHVVVMSLTRRSFGPTGELSAVVTTTP